MRKDYIVYEYITINVRKDLVHIYIDFYKKFGWIHINNKEKRDYYINNIPDLNTEEIKFKRDKNIEKKEELNKLQGKCEKAFLTIDNLEKMPEILAQVYSLNMGFIALVFIAISVFMAIKNIWWAMTFSGIAGFIGCIFPYPIYKKVADQKKEENKTKIKEQYDIINNIYGQAKEILLEN